MTLPATESEALAAGTAILSPLFVDRGFTYVAGEASISSGGRFANGFYRRGGIEVGLIVRNGSVLGCPNYSVGKGYAGHADLMASLGRAGHEALIAATDMTFVARAGGDPFVALAADLQASVLPLLDRSEAEFCEAVDRAVKLLVKRRGW